ncbi:MAG: hypothetical protein ACYTEX_26505 [Planctomycetota bacterium]|jgi:hypothetical protein
MAWRRDIAVKALTVCVGFDDLLAATLPRNLHHFKDLVIVTSETDRGTGDVLVGLKGQNTTRVGLWVTNVFSQQKATFNKGAAIEQGLDYLGRDGWLCFIDADVLLPPTIDLSGIEPGSIYSAPRRMLEDISRWRDYEDPATWKTLPLQPDKDLPGCFWIFHADDPHLGDPPWWGVDWKHAGGCDTDLQARWPEAKWKWLPFEVLHLGPAQENWWGRATRRMDGTLPEGAQEAAARTAQMRADRRIYGYKKEKLR